jgi:hypothetical protein
MVTSHLEVLAYMMTQGRGIAERNNQRIQEARDDLRQPVGFSVAVEIEKLEKLKKSGSITNEEFSCSAIQTGSSISSLQATCRFVVGPPMTLGNMRELGRV